MPQIGEWVIVQPKHTKQYDNEYCVGKIYKLYGNNAYFLKYTLSNNRVVDDLYYVDDILYHSNNREDLDVFLNSKKYNL